MFDMLGNLIPGLLRKHSISGIICFPDILGRHRGAKIYWTYLKVFGIFVFLKLFLRALSKRAEIVSQYILRKHHFFSFGGMFKHYGLKAFDFNDPNDRNVTEWVKNQQIDVILLFTGHILKKEIIDAPKVCILNKHAALLPKHKGIFPVFWAMLNKDNVGVTIYKINEKIDDGNIALQKKYEAKAGLSVYEYYKMIFDDTPGLILESLELLGKETFKTVETHGGGSYFGMPTKEIYKEFKKQGLRFA